MEFSPFNDGEDGEYNGTDFVETTKIFVMLDACFFPTVSFNRVYIVSLTFAMQMHREFLTYCRFSI